MEVSFYCAKILSVIGDVTSKEVAGQMISGNLSNVMNLFSNQPNNSGANLLQSNITSGIVSNLTKKLGIAPELSNKIALIAVPVLVNLITKKNNSTPDNDSSPLKELFEGGAKGNLGEVAKNILGSLLKKK